MKRKARTGRYAETGDRQYQKKKTEALIYTNTPSNNMVGIKEKNLIQVLGKSATKRSKLKRRKKIPTGHTVE